MTQQSSTVTPVVPVRARNDLLRQARLAQRSGSGRGVLTQQELADRVNAAVIARNGRKICLDGTYVSLLERGVIRWPVEDVRAGLRAVLGVRTDAEIGLFNAPVVSAHELPCVNP